MNNTQKNYSVDLKWALWSADKNYWDEHQHYNADSSVPNDSLWDRLKAAFEGQSEAITVYTAPWKEIRFGEVTIEQGSASFRFYTEWDTPYELVPEELFHNETLSEQLSDYLHNWFFNQERMTEENPIGALVEGHISDASDFNQLMKLIDQQEDALIEQEQEASIELEQVINAWLEEFNVEIKKSMIGSTARWQVIRNEKLKPFGADALTGTLNELEAFATKKAAQAWLDQDCPIAGDIDRTHVVWAASWNEAFKKDKTCLLYQFPEKQRMDIALFAEKRDINLFDKNNLNFLMHQFNK